MRVMDTWTRSSGLDGSGADMSEDDHRGRVAPADFPAVARLRFRLRALDAIELPEYAGSAWRGRLGHGLRRTVCVTRRPTCAGCLLTHACCYSLLFETPPPPGHDSAGFSALPHPYVLDIDPRAPRRHAAGDHLDLGITLLGTAGDQAPYLIHALTSAGQLGIGRDHGRFMVAALLRESAPGSDTWVQVYDPATGQYQRQPAAPLDPPSPPASAATRLHLSTPLRIKRDGHFTAPREFTLTDLFHPLYIRLQRLAALYGGQPQPFEWSRAAPLMDALALHDCRLRWHDWTRYSSRQGSLMQLGGLLGELTIQGPALAEVWPVLWAGQWTHVGKGTAFGLGAYRLAADAPA